MGFARQEYWSGLPCPTPGDLPNPGIELASLMSPALAGRFFPTSDTWEDPVKPNTFFFKWKQPWFSTENKLITQWEDIYSFTEENKHGPWAIRFLRDLLCSPSPKFICWNHDPQHLKMQFDLETGSVQRKSSYRGAIRVVLMQCDQGSYKGKYGYIDRHTQRKDDVRREEKVAVYKPKRRAGSDSPSDSEDINPANILIWKFWSPELWENR